MHRGVLVFILSITLLSCGGSSGSSSNTSLENNGQTDSLFIKLGQNDSFRITAVDSGDIDNDGDNDLLIGTIAPGEPARILLNNGSGIFSSSRVLPSSYTWEARDVELKDIDNDNDLDAIILGRPKDAFVPEGYSNIIWLNNGNGYYNMSSNHFGGSSSRDMEFGDIDSDGDLDMVVAESSYDRVWLNDGTGSFTDSNQSLGTDRYSIAIKLFDADGDGDLDAHIISNDFYDESDKIFINNGTGIFSDSSQRFHSHSLDAAIADIDNDGDLDIISYGSGIFFLINDSLGNFTKEGSIPEVTYPRGIAIADFDNDNDYDIFVSISTALAYIDQLFLNNGTGNFSKSDIIFDRAVTHEVVTTDFDGDSDLDLFICGTKGYQVWINTTYQ